MRGIENVLSLCAGALLLSGAFIGVQPIAGFQPPLAAGQKSSPAKKAIAGKQKKWKGKLVDENCLAKAMNTVSVHDLSSAGQGAPHFANGPLQPEPFFGGGAQQNQPPVVTCPGVGCGSPDAKTGPYPMRDGLGGAMGPGPGNSNTRPDINARLHHAAMVDDAVKKCPASQTTSDFGLVLSSGQVIEFNQEGNSKASQAIKVAELSPGSPAKATVEAIEENSGSVRVTSVQIKGKRKK